MESINLASQNPDLASQWHPTKNGNLKPELVRPKSNKKVWWLGKCGHEWEATIASRNAGAGCPYCSGYKALSGFNDLETLYPELALEWHPTKNQDLKPSMVRPGSDRKVWWLCSYGHEYMQRIANRKNGEGCPYCKSEKISKAVKSHHMIKAGSLAETHPQIAQEWHPTKNGELTPQNTVGGYSKKVWWLGSCGHEWCASPSNRIKGTNCPICANQKSLTGYNDLQTLYPEIAAEWHPTKNGSLLPTEVVAGSTKKVWWLGKCGHEWKSPIFKRTSLKRGCPICSKKLQTSFPEQAFYYYLKNTFPDAVNSYRDCFSGEMELDIFIPSLSVGIEYDGVKWHESSESKQREIEKYRVCQKNGIRLIRIRESATASSEICTDFISAIQHPSHKVLDKEIEKLLDLLQVNCDVNTLRDESEIRSLYLTGSVSKPFGKVYPELLEEWDYKKNNGLNPDYFSVSSGAYVWWKCKSCGYEWKTRIATRTAGIGCKKCGFAKRTQSRIENRIKQKGSLADNYPEIALEWHPTKNDLLTPEKVLSGSGKKCWWKCKRCGTEWQAVIGHRTKGVCGCPKCKAEAKS